MKLEHHVFSFKLIAFQIICVCFSLSMGIKIGSLSKLADYEHVFLKNTYISGLDVGELSPEEAENHLVTHYLNDILKQELSVSFTENVFKISLSDLFETSNLSDIIQDAFNTTNELSIIEKFRLLLDETSKDYKIALDFNDSAINLFIQEIATAMNEQASNAIVDITPTGDIYVIPDSVGFAVDQTALKEAIYTALTHLNDFNIDSTQISSVITPKITEEDVSAIDTLVSSSSTLYSGSTGKATNINLGASHLDGTLIMPGETFSFNTLIGDTTLEKGYVDGPTIINGQLASSIGGGICQVSSTLYNAVLGLGLNSVQRQPHSKPVTYLPLGLDASISWDTLDYQFKNTLEYPIYIQAYTTQDTLHINLYSNKALVGKTYKLKSEILEVLPSTTEYIKDTTLASGSKKLVQSGNKGYRVKVTREVYENDTLIDTHLISIDTYKPSNTIYRIGL